MADEITDKAKAADDLAAPGKFLAAMDTLDEAAIFPAVCY